MTGRTPFALVIAVACALALTLGSGTAFAGTICLQSTACGPSVELFKYGPGFVNTGQQATYTYDVYNNGTVAVTNLSVSDDKCPNVTADNGNEDPLQPGDYAYFTCTYTPSDPPGDLTNTAQVTGDAVDEGGPVAAEDTFTTEITDLQIQKTVDLPAADPFDELTYTITVTNNGPDTVYEDAYVYDNGCDDSLASDSQYADGNWVYGLPPGESVTFTCHHLFNPGSGEGQDPNPYVNQACADANPYDTRDTQPVAQEYKYAFEICDSASTSLAQHTVSGQVFEDMNADGVKQSGEPALPGIVVYADLNNNGVRDEGEPFTTSDGQGNYTLNVDLGTTTIREDIPGGTTCSFPDGCAYTVDLPMNSPPSPPPTPSGPARAFVSHRVADPVGKDFGDWRPASVSGTVVGDSNRNGVRDSGETGLANILVYADLNGNGDLDPGEPSTTTAADGTYTLGGLKPGGYTIRHILVQDGRTCSAPTPGCDYGVTLVSHDAQGNKDFLDAPPPGQLVLPERIVPGVARLSGKTGCVSAAGFTARFRGQNALRMTLVLDGRGLVSIALPKDGKTYSVRIDVAKLRVGRHQLSLRVVFHRASGTHSKTLTLSFQRCAPHLQAPRFTG